MFPDVIRRRVLRKTLVEVIPNPMEREFDFSTDACFQRLLRLRGKYRYRDQAAIEYLQVTYRLSRQRACEVWKREATVFRGQASRSSLPEQLLSKTAKKMFGVVRLFFRATQATQTPPPKSPKNLENTSTRFQAVLGFPNSVGEVIIGLVKLLWKTVYLFVYRLPKRVVISLYRDLFLFWLTYIATMVSICSFLYFYERGETLSYIDGMSHLMIAKRVLESPTPGAGQLGGTWPPLPHIMTLPLVWNDTLFYNGLAGSIPSMVCFVATCGFLYKIVHSLTGDKWAGLIAALVFMLNWEVLYMQSTPMTELPLFLFLSAGIYYLIKWGEDVEKWPYLIGIAISFVCATLTRYESWVLLAGVSVWIPIVCWKEGFARDKGLAYLMYFLPLATFGISLWVGWNAYILDDPLYFYRGEYSDPSLWIEKHDKTIGSWPVSLQTYWIATRENVGLGVIALAGAGLGLFVIKSKLYQLLLLQPKKVDNKISALLLLAPFPFFVYALQSGQRPLHVEEVMGNLYNVRFGLIMVLGAAVFAGYLSTGHVLLKGLVVSVVLLLFMVPSYQGDIITRRDPVENRQDASVIAQAQAASWLKDNYDGGIVLMESFGNEIPYFESHINTRNILFEGAYQIWEPALANPEGYADWVVMRYSPGNTDKVWEATQAKPGLLANFELVFSNEDLQIYKQRDHGRTTLALGGQGESNSRQGD